MFKKTTHRHSVILLTVMLFILGCSTEKDAALNVGYHNMTARFNGYFNAGEIIKQSVFTFRDSYKDDFTEIIDLQVYPTEKEATSLFPDMDRAIEKCSKVIYRHSMPNPNVVSRKEVENCKWIDDNWLLIGQSHFYKHEYDKAEEKFKYVVKEYTNQASEYAAKIWLSKIHIQQGNYSKAKLQLISLKNDIEKMEQDEKKSFFSFINNDKKPKRKNKYQRKRDRRNKKRNKGKEKESEPEPFTKDLLKEYELTFATLEMRQENYVKAVEHIEEAIKQTRKRKERARYEFVLGQIYQQMDAHRKAMPHFDIVAKSNANYEMRFYAKINKALSNKGNAAQLKKELDKMLKDSKNEEYKDQIYYVLAEIDLERGDRNSAIVNLTKSARHSVNNKRQKAKTYLRLADMHFEDRLYIKSQKYYDSCITVMPKEHKDFLSIENKANSLLTLVENFEVYTTQDSLQKLALLPESEREKQLKDLLKDIKDKEKQKKIDDQIRLEAQQKLLNKVNSANNAGNKFYFYNQKALARGYNDFKLLWGQRVLEDNWRRATKRQNIAEEELAILDSLGTVPVDSLTVDILREGLPLSAQALEMSYNEQIEAMYNLGMIYKNQLAEVSESESYFQKIIDKEYEHDKVLSAAYQLYLIQQEKGATGKMQDYKNFIQKKYPGSDISALLDNPDYFKEKERLAQKDLMDYKAVLKKYDFGKYVETITAANQVIFNDTANKYLEKYYILKANAISKSGIGGIDAARDPLEKLVAISPDSPEGKYALAYLEGLKTAGVIENNGPYKYDEAVPHYFLVIIPNAESAKVNEAKINVSNFNSSFFNSEKLDLTATIVDDKNEVLMVKTFANKNKVEVYQKAFMSDAAKSMLNEVNQSFEAVMISQENLKTLMSLKDLSEYQEFYNKNYK